MITLAASSIKKETEARALAAARRASRVFPHGRRGHSGFPRGITDRLLLRELVHVVQYEKLGLKEFAAKYVTGFLSGGSYEAIPLEMNAHELDDRCAAATTKAFSVADEVQRWIDTRRF